MPATNKVGTQLLLSRWVRADGQALAIVRQEAVAEVWRILVETQLPIMKAAHADALAELDRALNAIGGDRFVTLDYLTKNRIKYGDLFFDNGSPRRTLPAPRVKASAR